MNKHSPYTYGKGEQRAQLIATLREHYENGASIRQISEQHHMPYSSTHQLLTEAGVTMRGRGGNNRNPANREVKTGNAEMIVSASPDPRALFRGPRFVPVRDPAPG